MRMEEISNSRYIKDTDQVERYLLNLVEDYFKNSGVASPASKEYIIKRAVQRMKEEMSFDNLGVLSITLPSGEIKTGAVNITLEDLGGEPAITEKHSAFNVSFGNKKNTACEGDDPRLSDERKPLSHKHQISDIIGLQGKLSTLEGYLNRSEKFEHEHSNKSVLDMIVYTGDKTEIDLTILDTLENKTKEIIDEIRQEISDYKTEINNKITEVNTKINDTKQQIDGFKNDITNQNNEYLSNANDYTDTKIGEAKTAIDNKISTTLVTQDDLTNIMFATNNTYFYIGTMTFSLQSVIENNVQPIDGYIKDIINDRGMSLSTSFIDSFLEYVSSNGNDVSYSLPYIVFNNGTICGMIQVEITSNEEVVFHIDVDQNNIPNDVKSGNIVIKLYSMSSVSM